MHKRATTITNVIKKILYFFSTLITICLVFTKPVYAQLFETRAKQAMLIDVQTGSILFAKNVNEQVPPASLAKLMTMEVVFNALKTGRLNLQDEFLVSENAWRKGGAASGGSTMFAELNSSIPLEALIQGVIVQSANDGCIIIAEGMAGSEELFAKLMTERAKEIGLENSVFFNSTGLPHPDQKVTMSDLVKLAVHLKSEYPNYYKYYAQRDFEWNKILQRNRNPLLPMDIGADGLKTGFTEESGYGIVGSINKDGRQLIVAMSGMETKKQRAEEARKILQWGLRAFEPYDLFRKGDTVGNVRLYGGETLTAPVAPNENLTILVPLTNRDKLKARISYLGPITVPLEAGKQIATLKVFIGNQLAQEKPLYAVNDVGKGPIHRQALDAVAEMAIGWIKK